MESMVRMGVRCFDFTQTTHFFSPAEMKEMTESLDRRPKGESQMSLIDRLREFLEAEARSGSMDFGRVTPLYAYRMWGGAIPMEDIENGLMELRRLGFMVG